jgi:release factor glutamine methyltransferase
VSTGALEVARANLAGAGMFAATRVRLVAGSWFAALPDTLRGAVDVVVSNPPYVSATEPLPSEVEEWEPPASLRAGPAGTEYLEEILAGAPPWLSRPGTVVLEMAPAQAEPLRAAARAIGYTDVDVRGDLTGRDRVLVARLDG